MSEDSFDSWGWRIPFLASGLLVVVGLWVRLKIEETPVFNAEQARSGAPFLDAVRSQPRQMLLGTGAVIMLPTLSYLGATYLPNYGTTQLDLTRTSVLTFGVLAGLFFMGAILSGGWLVDRFGRRSSLLTLGVLGTLWTLLLFPVMNTGSTAAFGIAACLTMVLAGTTFGAVGSLLTEMFETRYRYTATSVTYNVAHVIGGAVPPLLGAALVASGHTTAFALILAAFCLVSVLSLLGLRETRGRAL
jgi:MFS family permease